MEKEYQKQGTTAGVCGDWHDGQETVVISIQDSELVKRLDSVLVARRLANYLKVITLVAQTVTKTYGQIHFLNLEPEDMVALTLESAEMLQVELARTE